MEHHVSNSIESCLNLFYDLKPAEELDLWLKEQLELKDFCLSLLAMMYSLISQ